MPRSPIGRLVAPVATSSAITAPAPGPSWKPWAEKPNWWNTPSDVALGPTTGMSSGMRASMPAQARTIVAARIAGNSSHTVRALIGELAPVEHGARCWSRYGRREMAAADQHRAVGELLEGELAAAQDHHRLDEGGQPAGDHQHRRDHLERHRLAQRGGDAVGPGAGGVDDLGRLDRPGAGLDPPDARRRARGRSPSRPRSRSAPELDGALRRKACVVRNGSAAPSRRETTPPGQ